MKGLTIIQKQILEYIINHIKEKNYPPVLAKIGEHFKMSKQGARGHVEALIKKGFIERPERMLRIIKELDV